MTESTEHTEELSAGEPSVPAASCGPGCGCGVAAEPSGYPWEHREHWRSLEQLAGTSEAREFMEREFPVGA